MTRAAARRVRRSTASGSAGWSLRAWSSSLRAALAVATVEVGDGEVEVVVGVFWVGGGGALEEGGGVAALAAGGYALVVDDLRERKAGGDEGERRTRLRRIWRR